MFREAREQLDSLQAGIEPPGWWSTNLGVGKRQLVEIAKALSAKARILVHGRAHLRAYE